MHTSTSRAHTQRDIPGHKQSWTQQHFVTVSRHLLCSHSFTGARVRAFFRLHLLCSLLPAPAARTLITDVKMEHEKTTLPSRTLPCTFTLALALVDTRKTIERDACLSLSLTLDQSFNFLKLLQRHSGCYSQTFSGEESRDGFYLDQSQHASVPSVVL